MRIAFTPEHIRRSLGWIIAGTQNDYFRAGELRQQSLKITVGRDQDEIMRRLAV
jgi:hypothetical protein